MRHVKSLVPFAAAADGGGLEKTSRAIAIYGGAAALLAALVWAVARSRRQGDLGRVVEIQEQGGMLLKHHRGSMNIKERVGLIQDLVWKSVKNPEMRHLALALTGNGVQQVKVRNRVFEVQGAGCPARDGMCESRAIYNWVRKNVRYTGDVAPVKMGRHGALEAVDLFQGADRTVQFGGGDCDDQSILNATLLALNGIQPKLRVTAPRKGSDWAHIYCLGGVPKNSPKKWVTLDTTLPGEHFAVEAPHARERDFNA